MLDGTSSAFAAQSQAQEAAPKPGVTQAADIPSARVAARLSGKRVEALSERTETSTTWVNKNGSLTTEIAAGPVRFKDDATGGWRDVDLNLVTGESGAVEPKAHPGGLRLSGKTGTRATSLKASQAGKAVDLVTLGEGDQQITLQWKGGLPTPKLDGTRAEYAEAVPGADVVVEATRTGFEQFVEIKKKPTAEGFSYTLPLKTKGLKAKQQADGSVLFTDKKSKKTAVMPAPVMWDATVDPSSGEHTRRVKVGMKAVIKGSSIDLVVTPDAEFLADQKTKYPVTVDPSTSALSNVFDTYVQQGETVDWSADTELDLGNPGTTNGDGTPRTAQSFISWNTEPIQDALILDAKLSLWNFHSGNTACTAQPWEVWSSPASTTASRWTNRPAMTAKKATSTETKGNPVCTTAPDGWINADIDTLVQEWASAKATRGHMGLRATSETDTAQWKRVNSANAASNPPKLVVNYNYRPRTGTKQEAGPPYFSYGGAYTVNTTTPTLRDTFVDANGDKVNGTFQIFDNATNTQAGDVIVSPYVPSGKVASVTVPATVLANGKTYKFRTSPYDGTSYNPGWSAWKTFTVDTSAPSAPTGITSTDYPSGSWVKGAGQTGTFNVTPPAADHNWLEWSLDGVTWTKVATAGSAAAKGISVTPSRDGNHTFRARAVDKADNKSEAVEYDFHVGQGGFVQPSEGERTARRLSLVAEADAAKYDSVSFSWRRSAADAWIQIPAGHVTKDGQALTSWPVTLTNGKNAPLIWNTTDTVDPDGSVEIKADFTGPSSASGSTDPLTVVVDRNADGAAAEAVGPGSLNLLTGDYSLSETDVSNFGLSVERSASSRTPSATQEGQVSIFGKEWVSGTTAELTESDYSYLRRISDTAVDVVTSDDSAIHFAATADKTGWIPEPGSESLTLKGSTSGSFTLYDTEGTSTEFTKPSGATTWQISSTKNDGQTESTTSIESKTVTVGGKELARPERVFAPTSATTVAACKADPSTKGCRVLEYVYATSTTATDSTFGDFDGQVKEIRLRSTASGATSATAKAVQSYAYDASGRLRQTWDTQISPALTTKYSYDSAGRVIQVTPPGELAWSFTYGKAGSSSAAGDGMLLKASRAALKQGTAATIEGEAVTSVVYDVPLTGTSAPYKMGASNVTAWGQSDVPTDATAVFPADSVPAAHAGSSLGSGDYNRATVHYLGTSGRTVDKAAPGGHIATTEYDRFGNTVRELTGANREVAVGTSANDIATRSDLGIADLPTAERAELVSTRTVFDVKGTRELEEYGPLRRVDLTADLKSGSTILVGSGTSVTARSWTVNSYDEGRPTDGSAVVKDQITKVITGAQVREHPGVQGESREVQTVYDWAKGMPTKRIEDPAGLAIAETTEYDAQGRETKVIQPGGNGTDATTRITAYWSATGTGACSGRPEWADMLCSTGPAGAITGGGSNPSQLPVKTIEYDWWGLAAKTTETANNSTRTTTVATDAAGRVNSVKITGGVGQTAPETNAEYNTATGREIKTVSPTGGTLTTVFDNLGRAISYTDADGGVTTTEYDLLNRPVKSGNNIPSTVTYSYDHTAEPRGLVTKAVDSVAGTFTASYDGDGVVVGEKLPGGYALKHSIDPSGTPIDRTYTRDSDSVIVQSDTTTRSIHGQVTSDAQISEQTYRYDAIGRLTSVEDTAETVCTKRTYVFDKRSNRTSRTSATGTPGTDCPTTAGSTTNYTNDSADRQVNTGYTYDAFGRTTAKSGGVTLGYYNNDRIYQETVGSQRQTWKLDGSQRIRSWTVESNSGGTWSQTKAKVNHYDCGCDKPSWTVEDTATGAVTRHVESLGGSLAATTSKTGDTVLQLSDIHGDVAIQLPLDTAKAPTVLDTDEYGNVRADSVPARYGWLGAEQRSGETLSGLSLMGARLYDSATGRFLQADPVTGGGSNAYGYPVDPITMYDLNGKWWWSNNTVWALWKCAYAIFGVVIGFTAWGWALKIRKAVKVIKKVGIKRTYKLLKAFRNKPRRNWKRVAGLIGGAISTFMGISSVQEDCGAVL
ncbi:DNRLRE domain-containing protein [Streptomyces sp. H27-C3]|uniref:DNRLRE domain-containing protein n=1 Tax=Streptomyces sp. H27-C3 TaxID=3046305 RepID=UPI0024B9F684|nr:DNRLRE domain-containing protein [Streptomyces sp. H27-C3]MDJ0465325.1 DNRLRE domain-containing protein [Streptomyces sp. H27-C3]